MMGEIDRVINCEPLVRVCVNGFAALRVRKMLFYAQHFARRRLPNNAGIIEQKHKCRGAAIHNGDFIGDMAMLGAPLQGHFVVSCSGHALNNEFLRAMSANALIYLEQVALADAVTRESVRAVASVPRKSVGKESVLAM